VLTRMSVVDSLSYSSLPHIPDATMYDKVKAVAVWSKTHYNLDETGDFGRTKNDTLDSIFVQTQTTSKYL